MGMTQEQIDRLKAVCGEGSDTLWILASEGKICDSCESGIGKFDYERDATCAVEAFNAVPAIIAEVERLTAELAEVNAMLDWLEEYGIELEVRGDVIDAVITPTREEIKSTMEEMGYGRRRKSS